VTKSTSHASHVSARAKDLCASLHLQCPPCFPSFLEGAVRCRQTSLPKPAFLRGLAEVTAGRRIFGALDFLWLHAPHPRARAFSRSVSRRSRHEIMPAERAHICKRGDAFSLCKFPPWTHTNAWQRCISFGFQRRSLAICQFRRDFSHHSSGETDAQGAPRSPAIVDSSVRCAVEN